MATKIGGKSESGMWVKLTDSQRVWVSRNAIEQVKVSVETEEDDEGNVKEGTEKLSGVTVRMLSGEEFDIDEEEDMGHFVDWVNRQK